MTTDLVRYKAQLDDSSTKNRNLFVGFFGVLIYTLVMTLAVSDEDLLMNRMTMRIPLIDLGLPPIAWFSVVPLLLLILHVDLLHNLHEHLAKLQMWREMNNDDIDSRELQPFFYDFAFAYQRVGYIGVSLTIFVWLLIYLIPIFTLLVVQIRFGAYQYEPALILHMFLTSADCFICIAFYPKWLMALDRSNKTSLMPSFACVLILMLISLAYSSFTKYFFIDNVKPDWTRQLVKYQIYKYVDMLLPRLKAKYQVLVSVDDNERRTFQMLADYQGSDVEQLFANNSKSSLHKPIYPSQQQNHILAEHWWVHGTRLNLEGRSLNYADFSGSVMIRANFDRAQLKGAKFNLTQLQGASFQGTSLDEADLIGSVLQGANLSGANLRRANLDVAQLQGAKFGFANLEDVSLYHTNLQGADVTSSRLNGAKLVEAELQGANLSSSWLRGADFTDAKLQGADLSFAEMQGAILFSSRLQGATFNRTILLGATCLPKPKKDESSANNKPLLQDQTQKPSNLVNCIKIGAFAKLNQSDISTIMNNLPDNTLQPIRQKLQQRFKERLGHSADMGKAICGILTTDMVKEIYKQMESDVVFISNKLSLKYAKEGQSCVPPS